MDSSPIWHTLTSEEALRKLEASSTSGLDPNEAERRLQIYGENRLKEGRRISPLQIFLKQFADFMIWVLFVAALLAAWLGEPEDAIAIGVIVVLNAIVGFFQEYRAEKAMAALRSFSAPLARVRRSGKEESIPASLLVPGDIVLLEAGNRIPADLRLIEASSLRTEEAALTGESHPIEKGIAPIPVPEAPLGERRNMAYQGTWSTYGRASGVVVATGMGTELGKIAALLGEENGVKTPLQQRLADFGKRIAIVVLVLCSLIFVIGLMRGEEPLLMFMTALSLAVAAIPEALPAVVTVSLALGARRMARRNALIRSLPAVETLGSVTYICSDKTGTLTRNQMQAVAFAVEGKQTDHLPTVSSEKTPNWDLFLKALSISNDAAVGESQGETSGDPTEVALLLAAESAGYSKKDLEATLPRVDEVPFASERSRMSTLHQEPGGLLLLTKGAPENVLQVCASPEKNAWALPMAESMARDGLRVLAVAARRLDSQPSSPLTEEVESELEFLGLVGLIDPPRPEAKDAVELCHRASIRVVMITGDHPATARAIALKLGILKEGGDNGAVLTGTELARLSLEELEARIEKIRVYARVSPEQKIKIVRALQDRGEFVAMTGDGVNDAPALRRANIGIAMGKIGTDVAREASHMVLLDDHFATWVGAVREGRRIYDNLRKFIKYNLTGNAGEIWTLFLAPFAGLPIPLLPIHILWVNLVTDGLPGIALAAEPEEKGLMERPPRPPRESVFAHGLGIHAIWVGLLIGAVCLAVQAWAVRSGLEHGQSMVFTVLTLSQMGHVLVIRSERESVFQQGFFSNLPLLGAVFLTFLLQMAVLYVPFLNQVLKVEPLSGTELAICLAASCIVPLAVEVEKSLVRRGWLYSFRTASSVTFPADKARNR